MHPNRTLNSSPISAQTVATNLSTLLAQIPEDLDRVSPKFPLLSALRAMPNAGAETARHLVLIASLIHPEADERRTAEYILRHRHELVDGIRTVESLVRAARCAAEMDCRRVHLVEIPTDDLRGPDTDTHSGTAHPSVAEAVAAYLVRAIAAPLPQVFAEALATGVLIALDVAERHRLRGGRGLATIAMRSDARLEARLVTHLRRDVLTRRCAAPLARLLVGSDRTPPDAGLLWWAARGRQSIAELSPAVVQRWTSDVRQVAVRLERPLSTGQDESAHGTFQAS